jgi:hypothetical protein
MHCADRHHPAELSRNVTRGSCSASVSAGSFYSGKRSGRTPARPRRYVSRVAHRYNSCC